MHSAQGRRTPRRAGALSFVVPVLRIILAIAAVWALRRELSGVRIDSLMTRVSAYGWRHLAFGAACTAGSFLVLGLVEFLALRHADNASGARIRVRIALGTAFVANAMSQSVGIALLTGAAVRARAYARHGLDAIAVAQVTAFVTITATVGLLAAGAVALLASPSPVMIGRTAIAVRPLGLLLGAGVFAYLAWSIVVRRNSIGVGRWRLVRPSPGLAMSQVVLSTTDWLLAGAVLFAFMPSSLNLDLPTVLGAYVIAQVVAVTSHVPAGAGVFEIVVLSLLMRLLASTDRAAVVAALVMFRVLYYLVPLCIAILGAATVELARVRRSRERRRDVSYAELGTNNAG